MKLAGTAYPARFLYSTMWSALDWVFPPNCGGCQKAGVRWCEDCQSQLSLLGEAVCPVCGEPQESPLPCPGCRAEPPTYRMVRSAAEYTGPLRHAIHRLKYENDIGLGEVLSKHLIELYNHLKWNVDMVAPVPLSASRMRERGYNQSSLLARPLAYAIQKPYRPRILHRTKETRTQVGLSARERARNVAGAFTATPQLVRGNVVLLVDDVTTTGSTINACAQALIESGASAVFGITLARAVLKREADDQPHNSI